MQKKKTIHLENIVEIIGPTGVGKTTIMNELLKERNETDVWIYAPDLIKRYCGSLLKPSNWKFLVSQRFHRNNPNFKKEFYKHHNKFIDKDSWYIKKKRAYEFYQKYSEFQSVFEIYQQKENIKWPVCVVEESMIYRTFTRTGLNMNDSSLIRLAKSFPLPKTVIYLDAPAEVIAERAYYRKKTPPVHYALNKNEIQNTAQIQKKHFDKLLFFLVNLDVTVHIISVEKGAVKSAQNIQELLEEISINK